MKQLTALYSIADVEKAASELERVREILNKVYAERDQAQSNERGLETEVRILTREKVEAVALLRRTRIVLSVYLSAAPVLNVMQPELLRGKAELIIRDITDLEFRYNSNRGE